MSDHSPIEYFYIEEVKFFDSDIEFTLSKNLPPIYFNDQDEFPIVKIKITNHNCILTLEDIKTTIDTDEDGFTFEIVNTEKDSIFKTTNSLGFNFDIKGSKITKTEISYTVDKVWNMLRKYQAMVNSGNSQIFKLKERLDYIKRYSEKEIDNSNRVLNSNPNDDLKNKWKLKKEVWMNVKELIDSIK